MATHDYIISNASGAAVRADLNNALAAIATNNSSATEPTTTYAYQWWADTGSSPTVMKLRNAANSAWITLFQLDGEWSLIPFENGTAAAPSIYFKDSGTDTGIYSPGTDQVGISAGGTSRFEVSTTATTSTLPVVHPLGAVGTPSITFTGDLNTGIYSPAADTIAFVEGGVEAMRIDSSSRVGIGTTSPTEKLHVLDSGNTTIRVATSDTSGTAISRFRAVYTGGGGGSTSAVDLRAGDGYGYLLAENNVPLLFGTNASERARIDSSGRLLVGTSSSPSSGFGQYARLVVQGQPADATGGGNFSIQRGEAAAGGNITSGEGIGNISWNDNAGNTFGLIGCEADANAGTNDYPGRLVFSTTADGASSPTERCRIDRDGSLHIAKTTGSLNTVGFTFYPAGTAEFVRSGGTALNVNRLASDGGLVDFYQDSALEGNISVSGSTVFFNGAHLARWSQLANGAQRVDILRGSVLSNLDEMCEWGEEANEQLNRMKISDVDGDPNVAGVFISWDDDDDTYTDDFYCAMTGDFIIRIAEGVTVQRGDLLMSAGDGTAKPQDDDIIRSKTVAKVTSTHVTCTYEDGSYCVPCVLMAC